MMRFSRIALAVAAIGLAGPLAANDGGPPVLANPDLDALTANAVATAAWPGGKTAGGSLLATGESGLEARARAGSARWTFDRGGERAAAGTGKLGGTPPAAAPAAGDGASATARTIGGSIGRTVTARSTGSAATASAAASSPGLSSIGAFAQAAPGFSASASRSASSFSR
ncbi:MAG: hypothetical protein MUD06_10675 [Rhodospirillales bacterium]|jgi:hypothetical protein|nr:hypothetical protein [Rhodospirillales bacterium]